MRALCSLGSLISLSLCSMLRHPNICHLIGVCTKFPTLAVVMEFAPFGSLHSVLEKVQEIPQIDMRLKLKISMDAARGCHYLHANQIIHRDLKSPNILVSGSFRVRV